ncbi:MAG: carbohydrate ABC transporter permease [Ruminococcaceae bacterium]|nr:carbohydrate ABC transporter permease [Oscillospiraceae bacterium]
MKKAKVRAGKIVANLARYTFLLAFSYILLYPLIFMISSSLQGARDFFDPTVEWIPKTPIFSNFSLAFEAMDFGNSFISTLIYEMLSAVFEIISCAVAAYGLARFNFKGKRLLNGMMLLTILVPTTMIIIPSYINFTRLDILGILKLIGGIFGAELRLNVLDSPWVMWLPSIFAVGLKGGLFIYIYKQFFQGLPKEFEEAAWIDGAGPIKTFIKVIIPSSTVPIVTVTMFSVVWHWNDYYLAQMYLTKEYPLSVQLASVDSLLTNALQGAESAKIVLGPAIMAACLMMVLPLIIFYLVLQRRFIASIANSGIVG